MKRFLTAAILFAALAVGTAADDAEKALKDLNGSYTVKSITKGGQEAPEDVVKSVKSFVIKDGTLTVDLMDREQKAKLTVDPKQKPAHIDVTPTTGPEADKTLKGIYKFEKGVLTICLNHDGERPKDFDATGAAIGTIVVEKKESK